MGLALSYSLKADVRTPKEAEELVKQLWKRACDLPLKEIGDVVEFVGPQCNFDLHEENDLFRFLLIHAAFIYVRGRPHMVMPKHVFAFHIWPGEGADSAPFGLALHPRTINARTCPWGRVDGFKTRPKGWLWSGCCKTGYAGYPENGGVENFLRCHLPLVRMLDHARAMGILDDAVDESGFWAGRDFADLVTYMGGSEDMIRDLARQFKHLAGEGANGL